jgi:hypothetical protein
MLLLVSKNSYRTSTTRPGESQSSFCTSAILSGHVFDEHRRHEKKAAPLIQSASRSNDEPQENEASGNTSLQRATTDSVNTARFKLGSEASVAEKRRTIEVRYEVETHLTDNVI